MTLSNDQVQKELQKNFVCAWENIKGKRSYAGSSNTHMPTNAATEVTNCAGHHNVQMVFMTSDGRVLHCLPGYWTPRHFITELNLALELGKLYYKKDFSVAERNREYLDLHLRHSIEHTQELRDASCHQGFDKQNLEKRQQSDFHRTEGFVLGLKTPDQVLHERLAERPYLPYEAFDIEKFIDMGIKQYKYDYGLPAKDHAAKAPDVKWPASGKYPGPTAQSESDKRGWKDKGSRS